MAKGRVLVTGAGGFIGRWSVAPLLAAGYNVYALLSNATEVPPAEVQGAQLLRADLLNAAAVDELLQRLAPTHLLHFAWVATPGVYWHSEDNQRWLAASRHLLLRFRSHGGLRAVLAGSCAEYDWSSVSVCTETSPLADAAGAVPSLYAGCKLAMQRSLAQLSQEQGFSSAWGRIFFQFGPYEHPARLVPFVIRNLLMNRVAPCTDGHQVRSFLHAADVGAAFAAVLDSQLEGVVNIGSEQRIAVRTLIDAIADETGNRQLIEFGARAAGPEPQLLVPDIRRLQTETSWQPAYTLHSGLLDTIAWWRRQIPR